MIVEYESVYDCMELCVFELEDSVDLGKRPHNREYGIHPMNLDAQKKRIDSTDGEAYTQEEFFEEYGGLEEWDRSFPHGKVQFAFHSLDMKAWGQEVFVDKSAVAKLKLLWSITVYTFEADALIWNFIGTQLPKVSHLESDVYFANQNRTQVLRVHMNDDVLDNGESYYSGNVTVRQFVDLMKGTKSNHVTTDRRENIQQLLLRENENVMDDASRRWKNIVWKLFRATRMKRMKADIET